jgi:5-methyltetrahydrofolate--homocysteine methyltransferase
VARQQVSGLLLAHPQSKYFAVGKLGRDRLSITIFKGMLCEVERWLDPFNYEPDKSPGR